MKSNADEIAKEALTRVIVTQAGVDMKLIEDDYNKKYGANLLKKIQERAKGNYREFLLALAAIAD